MSMNCKQGDMARIIRSEAGNRDKIVQCVRAVGPKNVLWPDDRFTVEFMWEIDRELPRMDGRMTKMLPDSVLRPIRDQPGQDEMLRIAGLPMGIEAPVGAGAS
jgi:hypothetical protein